MEKLVIYIVKYSIGDYDDYTEKSCFATFDIDVALRHMKKGNRIVEMAKKHYLEENGDLKKKYENTFIQDAYFEYCEFNKYFIETVKIR